MRVTDSYVKVPGGRVFVRSWNVEHTSAPPIVLLHDSLGCVDLWRDFPAQLAQHLSQTVHAYDRLGFGRSDGRTDLLTHNFIREEAEIYFPFLYRALNLKNFVSFGHSVGGAMALLIAAKFSGECSAVISESAQAFVEDRTLEGIRAAQKNFANPERMERLKKLHNDKASWVLNAWTQTWLNKNFKDWNMDTDLPRVHAPTLVIHGTNDEFGSQEFPKRIAALVGGKVTLKIIENTGHVPHKENPAEILGVLKDFADRFF